MHPWAAQVNPGGCWLLRGVFPFLSVPLSLGVFVRAQEGARQGNEGWISAVLSWWDPPQVLFFQGGTYPPGAAFAPGVVAEMGCTEGCCSG